MDIVSASQSGDKTPFPAFRPEDSAARTTLPARTAGEVPATGRPGAEAMEAASTKASTAASMSAPGPLPGQAAGHITRTGAPHVADNTPQTALPGRKLPSCR